MRGAGASGFSAMMRKVCPASLSFSCGAWADDGFGSDVDVTRVGVGPEGVCAFLRQDVDCV